ANIVTAGLGGDGELGQNGEANGGAIYNLAFGKTIENGNPSTAIVTLLNTILATSIGGAQDLVNKLDETPGNVATVFFSGKNLVMSAIDQTGATSIGVPTVTVDPKLGPLNNNGGPTATMALQ